MSGRLRQYPSTKCPILPDKGGGYAIVSVCLSLCVCVIVTLRASSLRRSVL